MKKNIIINLGINPAAIPKSAINWFDGLYHVAGGKIFNPVELHEVHFDD